MSTTSTMPTNGTHLEIDLTRFRHGKPTLTREGFELAYLGRDMKEYLADLAAGNRVEYVVYTSHPITKQVVSARIKTANPKTGREIEEKVRSLDAYVVPPSEQSL